MAGAQAQAQAAVAKQTEYSKAHGVPKLFENLTAAIVYARPADLNAFLAAEVERVAAEGAAYSPFPVRLARGASAGARAIRAVGGGATRRRAGSSCAPPARFPA